MLLSQSFEAFLTIINQQNLIHKTQLISIVKSETNDQTRLMLQLTDNLKSFCASCRMMRPTR
jgi:hypothetical protein